MSLAGHQSPPIFKRGPTATARLVVLVAVCLVLLVADLRFRYLEVVRQAVSVVTHPLQLVAAAPVDFVRNASVYFATLVEVQLENAELRRAQLEAAQRLLRFEQLERENHELRGLLSMAQTVLVHSVAAEVLYDAPDPFARKVILDKGAHHGITGGLAVVDARGMIGQVTRVYPVQSEVTLITDKEQAVPVQVERTGLRGVLVGSGGGRLELRFVSVTADIRPGDRLVTSGLDGVFLAGLPVAHVRTVAPGDDVFLKVYGEPIARVERAVQVLALGRAEAPPPRPDPASALADQPLPASGRNEGH
ncbi:MAG TPA: rod shape-determining protein MreC [Rhodocyclaceae bacterium]|nr:rod shape-determining protein MreC [Rhodocyclaceae bacterium]